MSPLAAALTTLAIFVGSVAVVSAWLARRQLTAAADRSAYQIRNPLGYPPEGHLCLICLGYFVALEPPDFKLCAACRRGGP